MKKVLVIILMIFTLVACSNNRLDIPNSVEIYNTENPSNVIEVSDEKEITKIASIFEKNKNKILGDESIIDPQGLIMVIFKYSNYDETFNVFGKSVISDNYYFLDLNDHVAYSMNESDFEIISSFIE